MTERLAGGPRFSVGGLARRGRAPSCRLPPLRTAESPASGSGFPPVVAGTQGTGGIASGFLEMSNVDLTREFTDMIVNQRGFQANSRIITTSDEMLQELLSLKR